MRSKFFLYLAAGLNLGALSTILVRGLRSNVNPPKKDYSSVILSSLAAASTVGYLLANTKIISLTDDDYIDIHEETAKRMETLLV